MAADEAAGVQAKAEGVPLAETVEFFGKPYRVAPKVGLMPMLKFAHAANKGTESGDMEGMAAMYDMLRACIYKDDWEAFETAAIDHSADDTDLLDMVTRVTEIVSARPTRAPSASTPSARRRSGNSKGRSSSLRVPAEAADLVSVEELTRPRSAG